MTLIKCGKKYFEENYQAGEFLNLRNECTGLVTWLTEIDALTGWMALLGWKVTGIIKIDWKSIMEMKTRIAEERKGNTN